MVPRHLAAIVRKELTEGFRDKNIVIYLVLVPLFLYPALFFFMVQIHTFLQARRERTTASILLVESGGPSGLDSLLFADGRLTRHPGGAGGIFPSGTGGIPAARAVLRRAGGPDALVVTRVRPRRTEIDLYFASQSDRSREARDRIDTVVDRFEKTRSLAALQHLDLAPEDQEVLELTAADMAGTQDIGRFILSFILPLALILMIGTGTFYAAIDTVVGERERGTLETTLLVPAPRGAVLLGKYLFVILGGLLAGGLNLFSLTLSAGHILVQLSPDFASQIRLPLGSVLITLGFAALLSALFAALMMVLAVPARNYREGQSYLTPFYLVTIFPAMASILPGVELTFPLSFVPIVNTALLFKALIVGKPVGWPGVTALVSMVAACALALSIALRVSRREEVYLEGSLSLRHLIAGRPRR